MKKNLLLIMLCCPAMLAAQQTNGVTVSGLAVDAGTVTFNVSWKTPMPVAVWSDTVWVWVDYNKNGVMERLPLLSGATLTATSAPGVGKVIEVSGNDKGVWVVGNARTNSSFSATVKLFTATTDLAGACVYASNYPPVGRYTSASNISFTGVPDYKVVLERNDKSTYTTTVGKGESLSIHSGETVLSFTDKTGAPGTFNCIPMTGGIDLMAPATIAKGQPVTFTVNVNSAEPPASAITYTWSAPDFNPGSGTGTSYAPTAPAATGSYRVTLTARSAGYCDFEASTTVTVIDCFPSTAYTLTASATAYCAGSSVTFALSNTTPGRTYQLYKGNDPVDMLTGTGSAATFTGAFAGEGVYRAQVVAEGGNCAVLMTGAHTVSENLLPTNLSLTANPTAICNGYSATLTASATSGASYSIDNSAWQATKEFKVSPVSPMSYTLFVRTAAGCTASAANAATVAVNALPATPTGASAGSRCGSGTVTFSASVPSGYTIDWYTSSTGTTRVSGGGSVTSISPSLTATTTYYAQARNNTTGCVSSTRRAVTGTVKPVPTITRVSTSGAASQSVYWLAPLTAIVYTTTNNAVISGTGGAFSNGVNGAPSGTPSGTSYTISGSPSATGSLGYSLTAAVNGCTSAASAGTFTVTQQATVFASSKTWRLANRTWSDLVHMTPAACAQVTSLTQNSTASLPAQYISHKGSGATHYYYNLPCALRVCKSPWRLPTGTDLAVLQTSPDSDDLASKWGLPGCVYPPAYYRPYNFIWSSEPDGNMGLECVYGKNGEFNCASSNPYFGFAVRCVQ